VQPCLIRTPFRLREFKRRAAVEPVIGHLKVEHRMGCNHLAHRAGDAINAMLAAVGYNFHILLRWLSLLLREILVAYLAPFRLQTLENRKVHGRLIELSKGRVKLLGYRGDFRFHLGEDSSRWLRLPTRHHSEGRGIYAVCLQRINGLLHLC
jgi:hypothetical protein